MAGTVGTGGGATVRPTAANERYETDDGSEGYGWVAFAGTMVGIVGSLNVIYGIAAISDSKFYARDITFIFSDLNTWGWLLLIVGAIQFSAAFGIMLRVAGARWVGILSAGVNAIIQLLVLPAAPFLAIALFSIDILVIYGLVAHGRRPEGA
jgi:hypothetical protein